MATLLAQGRVVETRRGILILRLTPSVEDLFHVRRNEANPGDYVWIFDDGTVDVRSRTTVERAIMVPGHPDSGDAGPQQDHGG